MRQRILLVAEEMDLRARLARALQFSGYAVELATERKRAIKLATDGNFQVTIVAPGSSFANLAMMLELRDLVPHMVVLAEAPDEIARLHHSLSGSAILLKKASEDTLINIVGEMMAVADDAASAPSILCIDDCRLDLAGHVFVTAGGIELALTRAETNILKRTSASSVRGTIA